VKKVPFFSALFLITLSTLSLQILQTRILSVVSYYYLAFLTISMAMFGMTAGAVWVYLRRDRFVPETLSKDLTNYSTAFALSTAGGLALQLTLGPAFAPMLTTVVAWGELTIVLACPFFFSGVVVALALTRSPFPVGQVYAVDLVGAAVGCFLVLLLLHYIDAPSAILAVSTITAVGAALFARSSTRRTAPKPGESRYVGRSELTVAWLLVFTVFNSTSNFGLRPLYAKGILDARPTIHEQWNSFSRIRAGTIRTGAPPLWSGSESLPPGLVARHVPMNIDGDAATYMVEFNGDLKAVDFLRYDLTNLAYHAGKTGKAAVLGVGGGRDVLSAYLFGFRDIVGVELNPIFVDLLTRHPQLSQFAGLAHLPGVHFEVDEGRSWFARSSEQFDTIQMSLVDTWAATGAGALSLSENGLYTVEAWRIFLARLKPDGLFTVSRWFRDGMIDETARMVSVATAALIADGAGEPSRHIFLASNGPLATLIVSRAPLSDEVLAKLTEACASMQFHVLASPQTEPASATLKSILAARSAAELAHATTVKLIDISPSTDNRPFFFFQISLPSLLGFLAEPDSIGAGVVGGNLIATLNLAILVLLSVLLVLATIIVPLHPTIRGTPLKIAIPGTAYFLFLGLGFMFVEMALLQRLSVFLGHPTYSLAVALASLILTTGIGSLISERLPLSNTRRVVIWSAMLAVYLLILPLWLSPLMSVSQAGGIAERSLVAFLAILPAGLLMGFGFPTGMRLVMALDARPTPWFWGVNGAGGVLGSSLALACSMSFGINTTLFVGAVLYVAVIPAAALLRYAFLSAPLQTAVRSSAAIAPVTPP
jgi:hypothetical protein